MDTPTGSGFRMLPSLCTGGGAWLRCGGTARMEAGAPSPAQACASYMLSMWLEVE